MGPLVCLDLKETKVTKENWAHLVKRGQRASRAPWSSWPLAPRATGDKGDHGDPGPTEGSVHTLGRTSCPTDQGTDQSTQVELRSRNHKGGGATISVCQMILSTCSMEVTQGLSYVYGMEYRLITL